MNISRFSTENHDGFTLIEFIVIMSIFAVMVGVVMFNFNGFRSAVTLDNLAHDIGISIRQIQTNSGATLSADDPENEIPRGIAFYPDPENSNQFAPEFTLFKDDGDGIFNEGIDEVVDVIKIQTQDRIKDIQYQNTFGQLLPPLSTQKVGITFKRYKTDATFTTNQDGILSDASSLIITVASPSDNNGGSERTRTIVISKIGQVSIK